MTLVHYKDQPLGLLVDERSSTEEFSVSDRDRAQFRPNLDSLEVVMVRDLIQEARAIAEGIEDQEERAIAFAYLNSALAINESPAPSREQIIQILSFMCLCVPALYYLLEILEKFKD